MSHPKVVYVPWLHMHQPLVWTNDEKLVSNLKKMIDSEDPREQWDGKLIARAYKNPAKYVMKLKKEGYNPKIMLDFSGILLESLKNMSKDLKKIEIDGEKIGDIIRIYKQILKKYPESVEFAGTAYSHCYFPATPEQDWRFQIEEWQNTFKKLFGNNALKNVRGFWLPEMGIPNNEKLSKLIKILKDFGYEWIILPIEAVEGEKEMNYEQRIIMTSSPHLIRVKDESFICFFRVRHDFIDQLSGCDAKCVYDKCLEAARIFSRSKLGKEIGKIPALVVPASDGENGNVMRNEFFPKTFVPFFKEKLNCVSSMTISEFLHEYYGKKNLIKSEVKIKREGASWMDGHELWLAGDERLNIKREVENMSKTFHRLEIKYEKSRKLKKIHDEVKRALLIAETSCYLYWGTKFWFEQAKKTLDYASQKLNKLIKFNNQSS